MTDAINTAAAADRVRSIVDRSVRREIAISVISQEVKLADPTSVVISLKLGDHHCDVAINGQELGLDDSEFAQRIVYPAISALVAAVAEPKQK